MTIGRAPAKSCRNVTGPLYWGYDYPFANVARVSAMNSVLRPFSLILPLAALTACAGVPEQLHPPAKPLKIVMVAVPSSAEVSDLEQISSVKPPNDNPKDKALEQTFVDARLSEVFQQSAAAMTSELQAGGRFIVCSSPQLQELAEQLQVGNKNETL